tara:strand:- start:2202 stop:3686 length:1485 start_codon:yes stop_codon:yes gene_type:complete
MGIPYYYTHLIKRHNQILKEFKVLSQNVNLFIDANSLIYDSCIDALDEESIIKCVIKKIKFLIKECNSKYTFIAFDGVPPFAKIEQQRNRRYKSAITKRLLNLENEKKWDTCAITPGTHFMSKINEQISKAFSSKSKFHVSGSNEHGEGEHKIFEYIRNNKETLNSKDIILYGLDADLIMLSLHHLKYVSNIHLYRETPDFIRSINVDMDPDKKYLMNIYELSLIIESDNISIDDYMFLAFFMGNDFLPHFPSLNIRKKGMEKILEIKKKYKMNLINESGKINWKNIRKIVTELVSLERGSFKEVYDRKIHIPKFETREEKLLNIPTLDRTLEKSINPYYDDWKFNYYKCLFDIDIRHNENIIGVICRNYLEGLEWTLKYYTGCGIDYNWHYKFEYPPLFEDLINYIPFYEMEYTKEVKNKFNELMQLCYVLPHDSLHLVQSEIRYKLDSNWYKLDCNIIWAYCKYFWESHVILPPIDIDKLRQIVDVSKSIIT